MGNVEWGKCEICGKEGPLERTYFYYPILCECCGSKDKDGQKRHFEMVRHCKDCPAPMPKEIHPRLKSMNNTYVSANITNILPYNIWGQFIINDEITDSDGPRSIELDKNICVSKEEAEAFLALMQLRQLRKTWVGDWEQPNSITRITAITYNTDSKRIVVVTGNFWSNITLSFPTKEMAEDFLGCFRDLCEKAKILL